MSTGGGEKKHSVSRLLRASGATQSQSDLGSRKESTSGRRPLSAIFLPRKHAYTLERESKDKDEAADESEKVTNGGEGEHRGDGEHQEEERVDGGGSWLKKVRIFTN